MGAGNAAASSNLGPALIGFGEAAAAIVEGWGFAGAIDIRAYDIKTDSGDDSVSSGKWADYAAAGVVGCKTVSDALAGADLVFSLVTADQAHAAATEAAAHIPAGALFLDGNSCAPDTKRRSAERIAAAGGRYVDVAIMAPIRPTLHKTRMLLSGEDAEAALDQFARLDMNAEIVPGGVGAASTIKMVRSVMIKGLEALALECVLSARKSGVDGAVLASLDASFPGMDWKRRVGHMLERVATHGLRRAAEMREVTATIEQLKLEAAMSRATAGWQQAIGDLALSQGDIAAAGHDYAALADLILSRLGGSGKNGETTGMAEDYEDIPGTYVFDAARSRAGYHLNMFCMSLRQAANRAAFLADEAGYLERFPMSVEQRRAVLERDWNGMLRLGGNIYYTSKLAAADGITFQDLAALMTGVSREAYRKMMVEGGRPIDGNRSKSEWNDG